MIEAIVAMILLLGLGSSSDGPPKQVTPEIEVGAIRLQVPFTILEGGVLVIGDEIGGWPTELGQVLHLVLPSETVRIDTLAQLRGRVEISSPEEALAFCRLITSPKTFRLYWHHMPKPKRQEMEIVSNDEIDKYFMFGDDPFPSLGVSGDLSGLYGSVSSRHKLNEMGIGPTQCRTIPEGYLIRRTLMVRDADTNGNHMEKVLELVEHDGSYVRRESHAQDLPAGVLWSFPHYK